MIFNWYKIFNLTDFEALDLVSKTYIQELEGLGLTEILVTKGNSVSLTYNGIFLTIGLNARNPFTFEGHAVFLDNATQDVYLGIETT